MSNTRANTSTSKDNPTVKNDDNPTVKNDDNPTVNNDNNDTVEPTKGYVPPKEEESMIVMDRNYIDENGVQQTKRHGPVPVSQWPAYEKEHNL